MLSEHADVLDLAERELNIALILTEFSSKSYANGNLQHAADARSKAAAVCSSAASRMTAEINAPGAARIKSALEEVQGTLARLRVSTSFTLRVRRAG
jgi:hypothetical protein